MVWSPEDAVIADYALEALEAAVAALNADLGFTPAEGVIPHRARPRCQYINLRPVKLYPNVETPLKDKGPEHIDFVVVRENTGGIYTGIGGVTQKGTPLEVATQVMQYSRPVVGSRGEPPSSARRAPSRARSTRPLVKARARASGCVSWTPSRWPRSAPNAAT